MKIKPLRNEGQSSEVIVAGEKLRHNWSVLAFFAFAWIGQGKKMKVS